MQYQLFYELAGYLLEKRETEFHQDKTHHHRMKPDGTPLRPNHFILSLTGDPLCRRASFRSIPALPNLLPIERRVGD